jgi:WhiB family transcriptional regulator, redox-sensing transcriptional regulator
VRHERIATRAQRRLVDYYRTRAVRTLPDPLTSAWDWQLRGSCRELDPSIFFPAAGSRRTSDEALAKEVCEACPVLRRCRQYALDAAEPYGIWGGMTPFERAMLTPHTQLTGQALPAHDHHRQEMHHDRHHSFRTGSRCPQ